ncbi:MAG TPA: multidrug effflux MFS transporter [Xanthobacteraceae bacterium]|nr:multidrug effflux MFS transporter [Xanthobacteraceae bacterium]
MTRTRNLRIILILGALSTVSPFSIDMYLPAFPQIAHDLGTTPAEISLSVSGYFVGLAAGQLFYGPLLDRFGRKPPIYAGLALFILASLACLAARSPQMFIAARLLQALGGCAAQVGSTAMVRDYFPVEESAKIISLLILVLSVSPLFAPTVGGFVTTSVGWPWIFAILAAFALVVMALTAFLPPGHKSDPTISLRPGAMLRGFADVIGEPRFYTYAFAGAFSFAGLFVYITGSPIIFIDGFHVDPRTYGLIFAGLAAGCIGATQLNIWLTRHYSGDAIFRVAVIGQTLVMAVTFVGTALNWYGLAANIVLLLLYLMFCGPSFPNAAALALAPFSKNVGSAAALLGFIQMGIGALASTGVGFLHASASLPVYAMMAATAVLGLGILLANQKRTGILQPR